MIILGLFGVLPKTSNANTYFNFQQIPVSQDTSKNKTSGPHITKIQYGADGDIFTDVKTGIIKMYDNAKVKTEGIELNADYIEYDSKKETLFAKGVYNSSGRYVGKPIFKSTTEGSGSADSLFFNMKQETAIIYGIYTAQQGGFFTGGRAKVQPDNEIHIVNKTFSTCNLPHPHFGLHITKGILTENMILSGPAYLVIEDIPTPLFIPFGFFPKPNTKSSGFILPTPNQDATRGFSLNGIGYYMAFSDYLDGRVTGNIYTNGSFEVNMNSNYLNRYKYNGNLNLSYASTRNGLEGTPEYKPRKNFNIGWMHTQNQNARPGTTFTASVNAGTSSFFRETYGSGTYDINAISQNTLSSSIAYGKVFGEGKYNFNASLNHSQETQTKTISLSLPTISFNVATFNPFDNKNRVGEQKWYQKITTSYTMSALNNVNTKEELLFQKGGLKRFSNGMTHNIPVSLAFNVAKFFNFNANGNYTERWYLQSVRQRNFIDTDSIALDTLNGFGRAGEYNIGINMNTKIYGKKAFTKMGRLKEMRHILTPTFGFSYKPDFSRSNSGAYREARYYVNDVRPGRSVMLDDNPIYRADGSILKYSIYQNSPIGAPSSGEQANLNFGFDNQVEIKVKSKRDTTNGSMKKIAIIQGLSFSGSYNFMAKTNKLSNIGFSGRSQLSEKLGFNFGGTLNPYIVGMVTPPSSVYYPNPQPVLGVTNRYTFSEGKLPRLTNFNLSFDYSLNPDALKSRNRNINQLNENPAATNRTQEQIEQLRAISSDPNAFVDFNVPWNFSFSYSFGYSNLLGTRASRDVTNTLSFHGDVNITPKWKIQYNSGWDFKAKNLAFTSLSIYRDLHCWSLSANWVPFGALQSYSVTIQVNDAILQDLKLSKRKAFYTRY